VEARAVIVATGVVDEFPPIEGIEALFGRSVHVCPCCDGWEHKDAPIAVYGQGSKGVALALLLRQPTNSFFAPMGRLVLRSRSGFYCSRAE
jgi:thioredoxin reductase